MLEIVAAYFIIGLVVSVVVACWPGRRKGEFSPLLFLTEGDPFSILLGFALWPLWILVQLIERSVPPDPPPRLEPPPVEIRIGAVGRALTDLKPGGRVEFDSTWLDGVTDGGIISAGERIEVVERMPTGLRVRAIPDQAGEGANERGEAR